MKKSGIVWIGLLFLFSCLPKQQWKRDAIDKREKYLLEASKRGIIDTASVHALINDYITYADQYPSDSDAATYLFKAADFYRFMRQPLQSVQLYNRIYGQFPKSEKRPYSLFLQGFIYENDVKNLDSARVKYQQFLDNYPNHPIAKDVRVTLDNLGKTPEQMFEEFQKNKSNP